MNRRSLHVFHADIESLDLGYELGLKYMCRLDNGITPVSHDLVGLSFSKILSFESAIWVVLMLVYIQSKAHSC